ncbi:MULTISPECIES: DUF2007 domain-containing protein [Vibrio]|uniref:DUF2007 domain-containing protein n=1 Tax=Vibrio TaxID=662 RepID=UPI002074B3FE|nr:MULTISPECIES: DUF2007 domain-containing protein [Vibrio]USD31610.1 DUF2007 domain-containing protein [Vibrio sp. SCSIO 43186]USD44653.1 DUF2007 domain-containing protein [Vibrio sp. SCSIO 43145]USD68733.1 DUF2007 domain-containing protein [Vibrio sp. SCSIO 43139]USD96422.1 hypothetical protein CTT30_10140 [Vibrio coralliilyticus]
MKIFTANTPPEAHIICELLKSNHIDCEVRGEGIFGLQGEVPFGESSQPYVWLIDTQMAEQACTMVEQHLKQSDFGNEWHCEKCGESNEAQFGVCWQCGATSPV